MFTGTQCWKLTNVFDRNRLSQSDSLADPHRKDLLNFFTNNSLSNRTYILRWSYYSNCHFIIIYYIIVIAGHQGLYIVGIQNFSVVIPL